MITITQFSPAQTHNYIDELVVLLTSTVNHGASIGWLAPMSKVEARRYWFEVETQIEQGDKILIVAQQDTIIVGLVQLALEPRDNGNHRAEVQKLMVHLDYRRQGIAFQLMEALETTAQKAKRTLLVLDVRKYDSAEFLYRKMGYIHVGDIPAYARSSNMVLNTTALYYKLLTN